LLLLIIVVGIARLALSLGGVPNSISKWLSITAVVGLESSILRSGLPTTGFGSYQHLLLIYVLQSPTAQLIIVPAIGVAIFTGVDNI
jgi:hypothetical protein